MGVDSPHCDAACAKRPNSLRTRVRCSTGDHSGWRKRAKHCAVDVWTCLARREVRSCWWLSTLAKKKARRNRPHGDPPLLNSGRHHASSIEPDPRRHSCL